MTSKYNTTTQDKLETIRITKETKEKIKILAETLNLKQITVLEYLLSGKINLDDLK